MENEKKTKIFHKKSELFLRKRLIFSRKNLWQFLENLFTNGKPIYLTDAERKMFNYDSTNAQITLKVNAKHFLQFTTDYGGIFTIHDAQLVLQTPENRLFTHHKQDFIQFTI